MDYFKGCKTIEDVKSAFKEYAKRLHPDCGGDAEQFKNMMQDYSKAFERLKRVHVNASGETYEKETTETPEQFADIIEKIIHFDGVKIEIIGSWIWLSRSTMLYKDDIKAAGFWWSKSKKAWYYSGDDHHGRRRGHYSMSGLRQKWGTMEVETEEQRKLA